MTQLVVSRLLCILAAALVVEALPLAQSNILAPAELYKNRCPERIRAGFQEGAVTVLALTNEVTIRWRAWAGANAPQAPQSPISADLATNSVDGNVWASATQELGLRFEPTACAVVDGSILLVCGITSAGSTVIDKWTLKWPQEMPAPTTEISTGLTRVSIVLPTFEPAPRIYGADIVGKRYVRNISPLRRTGGPATDVLVQFYDSNDIYLLSLAAGAPTLLATSTGGALGPIAVLAERCQNSIAFGDRQGIGFSYVFGNGLGSPVSLTSPAQYPTLILIDTDKDGGVDTKLELVDSDYFAQGWGVATNFNNWWRP